MGKLEGKVALVTGWGHNIGRATVLMLAGEGAHVVVNARSNQQEAESVAREARDFGVRAVSVLADVGKKAEVEALVRNRIKSGARKTRAGPANSIGKSENCNAMRGRRGTDN